MKDALEQYQALPNNLIYSEILFPFDYLLRTTKSARITVCNDDIFANHLFKMRNLIFSVLICEEKSIEFRCVFIF